MIYLKSNKKGSVFDVILLLIVPIFLIVMICALYLAYDSVSVGLQDAAIQMNSSNFNSSIQPLVQTADKVDTFWDTLFIFIVFGVWIVVMVTAFILGNNPIFLAFYGMASFGLFFLAIVGQVALDSMVQSQGLEFLAINFPKIVYFIDHFIVFALVMIIGVGIALYLKPRSQAVRL